MYFNQKPNQTVFANTAKSKHSQPIFRARTNSRNVITDSTQYVVIHRNLLLLTYRHIKIILETLDKQKFMCNIKE